MTTPSAPLNHAPPQARRRNPRLLILLLVVLCTMFVAGYYERLARLDATRQAVVQMEQQVTASQQRNATLREERERLQNPDYLALLARDDIGLVQDGDLPVVIYEGRPTLATPSGGQTEMRRAPAMAPWQEWLELLLGRAQP